MKPGSGPGWIALKIKESGGSGPPTVFLGVPKRVVPLATGRNRIKRVIREVLRKENFLKAGRIYRFSIIRSPKVCSYASVREELATFF